MNAKHKHHGHHGHHKHHPHHMQHMMLGDEGTDQLRAMANLSPYGAAANLAYDQRKGIGKLFGFGKNKFQNALNVLHRAKRGDRRAIDHIKKVDQLAEAGHPAGVEAKKHLLMAHRHSLKHAIRHPLQAIIDLYHHGIA